MLLSFAGFLSQATDLLERGGDIQKQIFFEGVEIGASISELVVGPITTERLVRWAAGAGDFNPIHYDQELARKLGLPNVIVPGPFKSALVCRMLLNWAGKKGRLKKLKSRYMGMDVPGDTLTCRGRVTDKYVDKEEKCVECEYTVENQRGETTVKGMAVVCFDS